MQEMGAGANDKIPVKGACKKSSVMDEVFTRGCEKVYTLNEIELHGYDGNF